MAVSPPAILTIIAIYTVFFAVITAAENDPDEPDTFSFDSDDCDIGLNNVCGLGDILGFVFDIIQFFFDALTFNVEGAPFYIRIPIAFAIVSSMVWAIINLIRGTEG